MEVFIDSLQQSEEKLHPIIIKVVTRMAAVVQIVSPQKSCDSMPSMQQHLWEFLHYICKKTTTLQHFS